MSSDPKEQKKPGSGNQQSAGSPAAPATHKQAKAGKDAGSHTKADSGKGAGGGKKQARKH